MADSRRYKLRFHHVEPEESEQMPPGEAKPIRIGNMSGFYGDRFSAMREMLTGG